MTTPPKLIQTHPLVVSRMRVALGTFIAIEARAASEDVAQRAVEAAFDAVTKVQRLMHPTRGADLAALSACAAGTTVALHPWTRQLLGLCTQLNRVSHGLFDPCLSTAPGRFSDLRFPDSNHVTARVPVHVDLGGIAKGYAVDRALDALRAAGCDAGLVNAGGDLAVFGAESHPIAYRDAYGNQNLVHLRNCALATSDAAPTPRPSEHRGYYHGLDRALDVAGKVTVLAASAALADGLTNCLLCGTDAANAELLRVLGAEQMGQNARPIPRSKRVRLLFSSNH